MNHANTDGTNNDRRKVLEMVASGTISVTEADQLMNTAGFAGSDAARKREPKFLRLVVEAKPETQRDRKIDIRLPLGLLRNGIQIARCLPTRKKGMTIALGTHSLAVDLNGVDPQNAGEFIHLFKDLTTDIDKKDETLRLFCE